MHSSCVNKLRRLISDLGFFAAVIKNPQSFRFLVSGHLMCLHSPLCVRSNRRQNFSRSGLNKLSRVVKKRLFAYAKTKTQISFAKLISAFVFAIRIAQCLYYLNPKIQASSHLLWLYRPVCVGPGRTPRRPVSHNEAQFVPYLAEQSMRFCSERSTNFPVFFLCCPSSAPVAENAQHEPHCP